MLVEDNLMYDIHKCFNVLDNFMYCSRSSLSRMSALGVDGGDEDPSS